MSVELKGASARALTAGILLLSRARSFGLRLDVSVVGDPDDIALVTGPALLYSPVLHSCGVGRGLSEGGTVILPGPAAQPLAVCLHTNGEGPWFLVDRSGQGAHPATRAFVQLARDPRPAARHAALTLQRALTALGVTDEPAVLDLLFGAPAPPLVRITLAMRAGRAMSGRQGPGLTRYLVSESPDVDPLTAPITAEVIAEARASGRLDQMIDHLAPLPRLAAREWLAELDLLSGEDGDRSLPLVLALAELLSHVVTLPAHCMLPPLDQPSDAVAAHLGRALGATRGTDDASRCLSEVFRVLGGRFVPNARYPVSLEGPPPPPDRLERWAWFCESAREAAERADVLWRRVMDPVQ